MATHFSLSNLGEEAATEAVVSSGGAWDFGTAAVAATDSSPSARAIRASDSERFFLDAEDGVEKKDVMLLSGFDFLAAEASSVALRFREAADMVFVFGLIIIQGIRGAELGARGERGGFWDSSGEFWSDWKLKN